MIESENYRLRYAGDGSQTAFPYGFPVTDAREVRLVITDADGNDSEKVEGTDFTVEGVGSENEADRKVIYPVSGIPLAEGEFATVLPGLPLTQKTELPNAGPWLPKVVEKALDRAAIRDQQLQEQLDRCIQTPIGSTSDPSDTASLLASIQAAAATCTAAEESAAASAADASASATSLNLRTINSQSGDYTVVAGDKNKLVRFTGSTNHTFSLTAAATLGSGFEFEICHNGSGGTLTIDPNASEQIDGANTIALTAGQAVVVVCDGTKFILTQAKGYGAGAGTVTSLEASGGVGVVGGGPITGSGEIQSEIAVNNQTGTTYTFVDGDRGKLVSFSNAASIAAALPQAGAASSFLSKWSCYVENRGAGTLTITPATSTIDGASTLVLTTNQGVFIVSDGTNYFTMRGISGSASAAWTTGDVKMTLKSSPDSGWVMADDGTIGDASSTATNRANADTADLFALLWNNVSDSYAPVSGGRGGSAAADFAAHKTIGLTKMLGRALGCAGAGSGLSSRALGQTVGSETHTLSTAEMPSHSHTASEYTTGSSGHTVTLSTRNGGASGNQLTTDPAGGDGAHNNMQPTSFLNAMIKL